MKTTTYKPQPVENFLNFYQGKKNTHKSYKQTTKQYFDIIQKNPEKYIVDIRLLENGEKVKQIDTYQADIIKFWNTLKSTSAPKTIKLRMAAIKQLFLFHEIELPLIFWKRLQKNGNGDSKIIDDKVPTHDILKQILQYGDIRARALFLVASSSGLRIGEIVRIQSSDIIWGNPTRINIRAEIAKNKTNCFTFITPEAESALRAWINTRKQYIETYKTKILGNLPTEQQYEPEDRSQNIFPFSEETAREVWNNLCKKANLDDKSHTRMKYHIHTLRKFFRQNFPNKDVAGALMNHTENLKTVYKEYSEQQIADIYKEGMNHLFIFEKPVEQSTVIEQQQEEINNLKEDLKHFADVIQLLNDKLTKLEES